MWNYEKRLQYPVNIKTPNPKIAQIIMSQYGGPDGEIGASMRYLSQRFAMTSRIAMGTLTDIGIEAPEMFPFLTPPSARAPYGTNSEPPQTRESVMRRLHSIYTLFLSLGQVVRGCTLSQSRSPRPQAMEARFQMDFANTAPSMGGITAFASACSPVSRFVPEAFTAAGALP